MGSPRIKTATSVHRQQSRPDRQARSENRHHHRISTHRQEREGPAHHQHRAKRHDLVHRAGRQHGRAARSENRREQARDHAGGEVAALRADDQFQGVPYVVEFGAPQIASIDPQTMAIKEYKLPNEAARPRRLAFQSDDTIWYTDYSRGTLGRLDLATGNVKEWQSPSGQKSEPYGIVYTKGALWYARPAPSRTPSCASIPAAKTSRAGPFRRWRHRAQHGRHAGRQPGDRQQSDQPSRLVSVETTRAAALNGCL